MVHDSMRNLRIDRRLLRRRGWVSEPELEQELADLPDVSEKGETVPLPEGEAPDRGAEPQAEEEA